MERFIVGTHERERFHRLGRMRSARRRSGVVGEGRITQGVEFGLSIVQEVYVQLATVRLLHLLFEIDVFTCRSITFDRSWFSNQFRQIITWPTVNYYGHIFRLASESKRYRSHGGGAVPSLFREFFKNSSARRGPQTARAFEFSNNVKRWVWMCSPSCMRTCELNVSRSRIWVSRMYLQSLAHWLRYWSNWKRFALKNRVIHLILIILI